MSNQSWQLRLRNVLWSLKDNKKARLGIMIGAGVLGVALIIVILLLLNRRGSGNGSDSEIINLNAEINEEENIGYRFIDGVKVEQGKENIYPLAVMIENYAEVRPQSGLQKANLVYEALAEGGITRFMAIYASDENIPEIGPVRSARPYFIDWAQEYKGVYAHVGGSPEALSLVAGLPDLVNLDQMGQAQYFWRDANIAAPHNLFTSSEFLTLFLRDYALQEKFGTYSPWQFSSTNDTSQSPVAQKIIIPFSSASYAVEYNYDRQNNNYLRSNGGAPHLDKLTNQQITVANVIVQFVPTSLLDYETGRLQMAVQGEGRAVVFHNGQATEGKWRKTATTDRTLFFNTENTEISFTPGNTWIEVLPDDRNIEYN